MAQVTTMIWLFLIPVIPYFFTILAISISLLKLRKSHSPGISTKTVSVVVACKNEENSVPLLIADLLSQDYPSSLYEIIIVDDHSSDSTINAVSAANYPGRLKLLTNKGRGKKSAIRTGIEAASGEIIMTTDSDCRMGSRWIRSLVSFFEDTGSAMIIGPVVLKEGKGFFRRFQELEFLSLQGITAGTAAMENPVLCNGANLAFTASAYKRHSKNLHDEILSGEDIFLLHSIKKEGKKSAKFLHSDDAIVQTDPSGSAGSYLKQRARWLSKAGYYRDWFTIILAIVTFVTIIYLVILLLAGFFNPEFLLILGIALVFKAIPDFLLLNEATRLYKKRRLMIWFIPSQVIYPFYVLAVVVVVIFRKDRW